MKYIAKEAKFSDCGKYRYYLMRRWSHDPMAMCIGLNPSTADAEEDDPTISALKRLLEPCGYGGVYMTNLFAFISSNPEDLRSCPNPLGENDEWLELVRGLCKHVIFAWGSFKQAEYRVKKIMQKFPDGYIFGLTTNGKPLHPLAAAVWQRKRVNFRQLNP